MYGLKDLAEAEGMTVDEMLEMSVMDSVSPAICVECGCTVNMEPDQDRGYCDCCGKNTVKSALILAGVI